MPTGLADLLESERGVFALLALLCVTVLAVLGKIDGMSALDFLKYLVGVLVASKTVTTAMDIRSARAAKTEEGT